MDLTLLISAWSQPVVTAAALFFEQYWPLAGMLVFIAAMFTTKKRLALVIALVLCLLLVPVVKEVYAQPRPCINLKGACESDFGLPSAHSAFFFAIATASVGTAAFFFFLPLGLFVAFSRVYLGVHSFEQMIAGIAFGVLLFFAVDGLLKRLLPLLKEKTGLI